ncbi:DUF5908 family protein [Tenacibaculum sp. M341]|uniref:DUF5908 family protein n=1 Tax=Tenacibaculum sp. M341 TaxID=2530339 RepID=UPI0014050037|nr:DUF5908 family protein [Tenacibaculum sp. M341]
MPIEIKELHIKINVDEATSRTTTSAEADAKEMNAMVRKHVEQIMHIASRKKER